MFTELRNEMIMAEHAKLTIPKPKTSQFLKMDPGATSWWKSEKTKVFGPRSFGLKSLTSITLCKSVSLSELQIPHV